MTDVRITTKDRSNLFYEMVKVGDYFIDHNTLYICTREGAVDLNSGKIKSFAHSAVVRHVKQFNIRVEI